MRAESLIHGLIARLIHFRWEIILLISLVSALGFAMLYSASGGHWQPWAAPQLMRFGVGMFLILLLSGIKTHFWRHAAYPFYLLSFILLIGVELMGAIGMGAQRWIALGPLNLQPSELMKIALILALARYFSHMGHGDIHRIRFLIPPLLMILLPTALVAKQPDLGTALLLLMIGIGMLFAAGVPIRYFLVTGAIGLSSLPLAWHFLRDYQKNRVLVFLNPEQDRLAAGYHILQSKIALGSGGFWGKGFMLGSQSHLNFLPEKQTDFIFTMFCEEFGFAGAFLLFFLYMLLLALCLVMSIECRNIFGRYVILGVLITLFIYIFINMSMVIGLVPVVGIPLPFVSYGGTALMTLLLSFGIVLGIDVQQRLKSRSY